MKHGSSNWIALRDLKNLYPLEVADYAVNNRIQHDPAFAWWVPFTLRERKAIIRKVKSKSWQQNTNFRIKISKSVPEAHDINIENCNHLWRDSINKETPNTEKVVYEYDEDPSDLVGYRHINGHIIFYVNIGK